MSSENSRMFIVDWFDGPTAGVVASANSTQKFVAFRQVGDSVAGASPLLIFVLISLTPELHHQFESLDSALWEPPFAHFALHGHESMASLANEVRRLCEDDNVEGPAWIAFVDSANDLLSIAVPSDLAVPINTEELRIGLETVRDLGPIGAYAYWMACRP